MFNPLNATRSRLRFGLMTANAFDPLACKSHLAISQTAACSVVYSRSSTSPIQLQVRAGPDIFERVVDSTLPLSQIAVAKREANGVVASGLSLSQTVNVSGGQQGGNNVSSFISEEFIVNPAIELSKEVTLSNTPPTNSEFVFLNGVHLTRGVARDYTLTGPVVEFNTDWALKTGDIITVRYVT